MLENAVTFLLVTAAIFFVGRSLYRASSGKGGGCGGCGGGVACSETGEPAAGVEEDDGNA